ncbi:hypothetical protein BBOR36S_00044 [Brevibacillus borstelensis]
MLYSKFSTPSLAFAHMKQARLPFVHLSVVFLNEAAGFTLCYGLLICSHSFELLCHRASTLGFLHQLPVSYEVTWLLPRLDFHQLAINGLLGTLHEKTSLPPGDKLVSFVFCLDCQSSRNSLRAFSAVCLAISSYVMPWMLAISSQT